MISVLWVQYPILIVRITPEAINMVANRRLLHQLSLDIAKAMTSEQPWNQIFDSLIERGPIRELILRVLLDCDEGISGVDLRPMVLHRAEAILETPMKITDTKLYYNLNVLQQLGLILETRNWRKKIIGLNPEIIAPLRRYFGIQKPWAYMGFLTADETAVTVGRLVRDKLEINPMKYFFMVKTIPPAGLWRPEGTQWLLLPDGTDRLSFVELVEFIQNKISKYVRSTDIILDISGGRRLSLAMFKVALTFGINAVYLSRDSEAEWIIYHEDS